MGTGWPAGRGALLNNHARLHRGTIIFDQLNTAACCPCPIGGLLIFMMLAAQTTESVRAESALECTHAF